MFDRRLWKNLDWWLLGAVVALSLIGCVMIFSATHLDPHLAGYHKKQIIWMVLGILVMIGIMHLDYRMLPQLSTWLYLTNLGLLLLVMLVGHSAKGAQRWIPLGSFKLQPSEFAKVFLIVTLATLFYNHRQRVSKWETILYSMGHIGLPLLLIFAQPDLGTALTLVAVWFGIAYLAGVKGRQLAIICLAGLALGALGWKTNLIKSYQKDRLMIFLHPEEDPRGTGYQIIQSEIAIGSGRLAGKGFLHGRQGSLRFIPANYTDFIFTVVGEEWGFLGAVVLLGLYLLVVWRGLHIVTESENSIGALIGMGIVSLLVFHVIVNIGMTVRIMPVTGVPLPFLSYGGSNMVTSLMTIGFLESIAMRRHKILF